MSAYPQGGFMISAMTARHDTEANFDIDVMAQIDWPANVDPEAALSTLDQAIRGEPGSRYYKKTARKTRCSTVHYDGMHLDVRLTGSRRLPAYPGERTFFGRGGHVSKVPTSDIAIRNWV